MYKIQIDYLNRISNLLTIICDAHTIIYNDIKWYYKGIELHYPYPADNEIYQLQTVLDIYLELMDNIILTGESAMLTQEHMIVLNEYWKEY